MVSCGIKGAVTSFHQVWFVNADSVVTKQEHVANGVLVSTLYTKLFVVVKLTR